MRTTILRRKGTKKSEIRKENTKKAGQPHQIIHKKSHSYIAKGRHVLIEQPVAVVLQNSCILLIFNCISFV
ncbi:MAG: hypothetical protein K5660_09550, partial [Paludibacteraceae bacterium]|nr:hypothetical protein [Paludibacteraceae bacterium]